jgi:hypothetical protein
MGISLKGRVIAALELVATPLQYIWLYSFGDL